jgi:pimeloyl-ACP methyl ester carboxylesterase
VPAAVAGTFLGGFRLMREISACGEWVRGTLPPRFFAPVASNVPALVMNGELDHLTPPRYGKHVAQSLARARHLVLPHRGHNDVDECITGMIEAFVAAGDAAKIDASCLAKTEELSFAVKRDE